MSPVTDMPRRRPGRPAVEVDLLAVFDAAAEAFAETDLFQVTMDDIARSVGLSKPVLYRRFGSKDEMFAATIAALCEQLEGHLFEAYDRARQVPVIESGRIGFGAFLDYAEQHPHGFRLLFLDSHRHSSAVTRRVAETMLRIADRVADMIRPVLTQRTGDVGDGAAEALGTALVGFSVMAARRHVEDGRWDREPLVDLLADFMRAGLLGVDASRPLA